MSVGTTGTVEALATRDMVVHDDPVSRVPDSHSLADSSDHAGDFMAVDAGWILKPEGDLLEIGPAHAARSDSDKDLPGPKPRYRHQFDGQLLWATVDAGEHFVRQPFTSRVLHSE